MEKFELKKEHEGHLLPEVISEAINNKVAKRFIQQLSIDNDMDYTYLDKIIQRKRAIPSRDCGKKKNAIKAMAEIINKAQEK